MPSIHRPGAGPAADIMRSLRLWRLSLASALNELDQRYRRTSIGKGWIALTFLLFVGVKVLIFGALNGVPIEFFAPYLAVGYMLFRFISQAVTGGSGVFVGAQSWIKTEPLPLTHYLFTLMLRNFITMAYAAVPTLLICLWAGRISWQAAASLPFVILLYALNHLWVSCLLGIVAARHRDVVHLLNTITQILYFATPVLWVPTEEGVRSWAAMLNPLTHYIAVLRDPLIYGTTPWLSWGVVGVVTVVGCAAAAWTFRACRLKLVYWI